MEIEIKILAFRHLSFTDAKGGNVEGTKVYYQLVSDLTQPQGAEPIGAFVAGKKLALKPGEVLKQRFQVALVGGKAQLRIEF